MRALIVLLLWLAGSAAEAGEPPYHVAMLLYRGCEEACQGFQDFFRRQGVAVRFTLLDANQDRARIAELVRETRKLHPDLVVTWGTTVTLEALGRHDGIDPKRHITDLPVVFMIVSDPVEVGIVADLAGGRRNVTGSLYLLPVDRQLRAARRYFRFHRLGFLLNPSEANSRANLDALRAAAERLGVSVAVETLAVDAGGRPRAEAIPAAVTALARQQIDLLYQGPDTFLNSQRDRVTGAALCHRLPVFAAAEAPVVRSQALFGVVNRYDQVGRFTARQALRILRDGVRPETIAIELPRRFSYLVNIDSARLLDRYPPLSLLDVAEIVGDDPANASASKAFPCD